MKTVTLSIKQISRPADLQLRESLDHEHIEELVSVLRAGGKLAPVKVVREGNAYWLWDGHHTVTAHDTADVPELEAIIADGDRAKARWLACSANSDHGLKRSPKTKRRQVEAALKIDPSASDRVIADHVKVSHPLVAEVRREMTGNSSSQTTRKGKDGRTTDTSKISEANAKRVKKDTPKPTEPPAESTESDDKPEGGQSSNGEAEAGETESTVDPDSIDAAQAGLDELKASIKATAQVARRVFRVQGQEIQAPWLGKQFSWSGVIGDLNKYARMLDDLRPVGGTADKPLTQRTVKAKEALAK